MPSLAILEGLIGTGCAVACLYYARLGAFAGPHNVVPASVPWHSALGEYARRNPFAAVFGALAFGFLVSSWSMYIAPRAIALPTSHVVEKWRTVTKNIPTPDPAQAAKIAALQTTINADAATIASQQTEIARLKQMFTKSPRRSRRSSTTIGPGDTNPEGTAAALNKTFNPAGVDTATATPASPPPSAGTTTPTSPTPVQSPAAGNGTSQTPASTPPH